MTILNNPNDFHWYKQRLDTDARQHHAHEGEPTHYPCKVRSQFIDNSDSCSRNPPADGYEHTFVYRVRVVCPCCQHSREGWPGEFDEPKPTTDKERANG